MSKEDLIRKFEPVFYPKSIAVVGASKDEKKVGHRWAQGLINAGFKGDIYPVSPSGGEISGFKVYPNLMAIPGPVDYVIVSIPRDAAPDLLDECAAKKVHAVHFFTAGFSEIGDAAGHDMEEELLNKAHRGGFHIIGPNCVGACCPESRFPYGPRGGVSESGSVGFICQSGGIGGKLVEIGTARDIKYSKGISFGNGIDLDSADFLEYMTADPKTAVIGAYLEGTRNGRRLFNTMKEATKVKPLIVWKSGRTKAGAAAARSHTGSLASTAATWSAALKQAGVIEAYNIEELADNMLIFQQLQRWQGKGIAIVGGLANGGGGISVSASDACAELGLHIPLISPSIKQQLISLLGEVGSILHNPVDVSQGRGKASVLAEAFRLILSDPVIDLLLVQEDMGILVEHLPWEEIEATNDALIALRAGQNKPIVVVSPPGIAEKERLQTEPRLSRAHIPVFPTMERAAKAIVNLSKYSQFRAAMKSQ